MSVQARIRLGSNVGSVHSDADDGLATGALCMSMTTFNPAAPAARTSDSMESSSVGHGMVPGCSWSRTTVAPHARISGNVVESIVPDTNPRTTAGAGDVFSIFALDDAALGGAAPGDVASEHASANIPTPRTVAMGRIAVRACTWGGRPAGGRATILGAGHRMRCDRCAGVAGLGAAPGA